MVLLSVLPAHTAGSSAPMSMAAALPWVVPIATAPEMVEPQIMSVEPAERLFTDTVLPNVEESIEKVPPVMATALVTVLLLLMVSVPLVSVKVPVTVPPFSCSVPPASVMLPVILPPAGSI